MEILETPLVQILLWLVAAAATIWILVPGVMFLRRKSRYWVEVSDNPADAEPDGRDRKHAERFKQFVALGFRPAGKTVEHGRFMIPMQWSWKSGGERYLASADGKTFVSFHRTGGGGPLRTATLTAFNEGGLIITVSPGEKVAAEAGGNYKREAVGEVEPEELLKMHARRVEEFARERNLTVKAATFRDVAAEDEKHSRLLLPKMKLGQYGSIVIAMFLMPAVMAVLPAARGRGAIAPLIICVAAAVYALVRWSILPSRIPMAVRMAVMAVGILVPATLFIRSTTPERSVARHLDRLDARPTPPKEPARTVDWIVSQGRWSCTPLVQRLENAASKPTTRQIAHDALVKLHGGTDLGETRAAWQAWCTEVTKPER